MEVYAEGDWITCVWQRQKILGYVEEITGNRMKVIVTEPTDIRQIQIYNNAIDSYSIKRASCELVEEDLRGCIDFAIDHDQKALFDAWTEDLKKQKEMMEG